MLDEGLTRPSWPGTDALPAFSLFRGSATVDVTVVGAGIAGLTSAYLLARAGRSVLVLDDSGPITGQSARTSAHLASYIDDGHSHVEAVHGEQGSKLAHESHAAAIDFIETTARHEQIACDFARIDAYLFPVEGDAGDYFERELRAAGRAGLSVERLERSPSAGFRHDGPVLRIARQARFDPVAYLTGLTRACLRAGVRFSSASQVISTRGGDPVVSRTADGTEIRSSAAVLASNVPAPINDWAGLYTKQAPYRTYMLAMEIDPASLLDALYWDTGDPYHYVRLQHTPPLLLVGGEDHKVGQPGDTGEAGAFDRLEAWVRRRFPTAGTLRHRWSGQVQEPVDYLGYLGAAPTAANGAASANVYVITGDSGMGLTHGTLGAMICSDLILGRSNPYAALYSPSRKPAGLTPLGEFVSEQLNVVRQYADLVSPGDVASAEQIRPGCGAVLREGLSQVAVYRADDGSLSRCSAICTHLGCVVKWNDVEKSWDCPCHGSRFDPTRRVMTGPAVDPLKDLD